MRVNMIEVFLHNFATLIRHFVDRKWETILSNSVFNERTITVEYTITVESKRPNHKKWCHIYVIDNVIVVVCYGKGKHTRDRFQVNLNEPNSIKNALVYICRRTGSKVPTSDEMNEYEKVHY